MYYYTTFEVTLGSWDQYGNNVGGGYTKMTVHPDAEPVTITVSPAPANSETASYPDVGILSQYSASAGAYEVLSDLFFMDPKVGGDGSRWGHPGGQEITIVGPLYMADLSIDFGDGTFGHTKVLEFEYTPQIDDGYRHTAMIALSGDLPWVYDLNILSVNPVDFTDGSIDYVARFMLSINDSGSAEEPVTPWLSWRGNWLSDYVSGTDYGDFLYGEGGDDYLEGLLKNDILDGGDGNDTLIGGPGNDTLRGDAGEDWLAGDAGDNSVYGGGGNDWVEGQGGTDLLRGGAGDDTIIAGAGNDSAYGDLGRDEIILNQGNDRAFGGKGADTIWGGDGRDRIKGQGSNDFLAGEAGNDTLSGGNGNDTLDGGAGNDHMRGGKGHDVFIYNSGHDVIWDFGPQDQWLLQTPEFADMDQIPLSALYGYSYQDGKTLVFDFGDGDVLEFRNMTFSGLNDALFQ